MTIVELSPGGGWYTEILANYIHYPGTLIAAHHNPAGGGYYKRSRENFEKNNGYSIDITSGGKSNEGFVRVSKGLKTWYYPNYYRNSGIRINNYSLDLYNNKI